MDAVFIRSLAGDFVDINPAGVNMQGYGSRVQLLRAAHALDLSVYNGDWFLPPCVFIRAGF